MDGLPKRLSEAIEKYAEEREIPVLGRCKVVRASQNGDSFAADVMRITIELPAKDDDSDNNNNSPAMKLIAKVAPKLTFRRVSGQDNSFPWRLILWRFQDMYNIPHLFAREMFMYNKLLPNFRAYQEQQKHLGALQPIFDNYPQLINSSNDSFEEFVLLADLCEEGYQTFERTQGASLQVCKEILRNFSRFHAISFVYKSRDKDRFDDLVGENLRETLFVKDIPPSFDAFLQSKIDLIRKKLENCPRKDIDELADERLKEFQKNFSDEMFETCHEQDYAVVCHGDSWISNFMYKVNEDHSLTVKLIDFQVSRYTTPVVDLSYFLATSTDKKLRESLPELLLYYYNTLMGEIRLMGCKAPETLYPYEVFTRHCKKYMKFGFG